MSAGTQTQGERTPPVTSSTDDWATLQRLEQAAIAARRVAAAGIDEGEGPPPLEEGEAQTPAPLLGLALSGGGVRSATFCLGLLRGLAQNGVLRRFDYLSTVSGGGYIGAAFGRLVGALGSIGKAEAVLRSGDSLALVWLRRNGRYLSPAGARDFGMAIATYLRAGLAVNFELGVLALLIGLCVIAPHLALSVGTLLDDAQWSPWQTAWWPIAACVWLLFAPGTMVAYWPLRVADGRSEQDPVEDAFASSGLAGLGFSTLVVALIAWQTSAAYLTDMPATGFTLPPLQFFLALAASGAVGHMLWLALRLARVRKAPAADALAAERNRMTRALRSANAVAISLFVLGAFDLVTRKLGNVHLNSWLAGSLGIGGVIAIAVRAFAEPLQKISVSPDGPGLRWLPQLINIAGIAVGLALVCAWVVLLQWLVFDGASWSAFKFLSPPVRAGVILAAVVAWYAATGRNCEMANASSLHAFYKARLVRAYVSLGNAVRFNGKVAEPVHDRTISAAVSVTDVTPADDIDLARYAPDLSGGPIHLVCACLNQTRDENSGLYNADRKGAAVVATRFGFEVGLDKTLLPAAGAPTGTLGEWIAISGAAAAPGAGSNTTSGWALLLFLIGARLGYWLDAASVFARLAIPAAKDVADAPPASRALTFADTGVLARLYASKPGLLASEALASFGGSARRWWFLSDGGHFDNTGVYALLRREADFIVLADCGADPRFEFPDLENLVRKARIDFDAEIEFYTRDEAAAQFPLTGSDLCVLSPEDMIDNHSARGVLLARIAYRRDGNGPAKIGTLLVVKPNLHDALDADVLAYARRNPAFPQQSTGDQFFDEAQWESYHRLGEDFGRALRGEFFASLPAWNTPALVPAELAPLRHPQLAARKPDAEAIPFWRRGVAATAIGTTLGVGAIGTLLLPLWQSIDTIQQRREADAQRVAKEKNQANELLAKVVDAGTLAIDALKCRHPGADASAPSNCPAGSAAARHDIGGADAYAVHRVYVASRSYPAGDEDMRNVTDFINRARDACHSTGTTCDNVDATAPNLCGAVCDPPIEGAKITYWSSGGVYDQNWRSNPVVSFVSTLFEHWFGDMPMRRAEPPATAAPTSLPPAAPTSPPPPTAATPETAPPPEATAPAPEATAPPPPPAEMPAPSTPPASTPAPPEGRFSDCMDSGAPMTVYAQIYDEGLRAPLEKFYADNRVAEVRVARIENVTQTAQAHGAPVPLMWHGPTLIMHRAEPADVSCAKAIAARLQPVLTPLYPTPADALIGIRSLPPSLKSNRHVIELWLPPAARSAAD